MSSSDASILPDLPASLQRASLGVEHTLQRLCADAVHQLYGAAMEPDRIPIQRTGKEFAGQYTVVVFPLVRLAKQKPEAVAEALGKALQERWPEVVGFNAVKGFLNLEMGPAHWSAFLEAASQDAAYGKGSPTGERVVLEYCGPNTNKPLHLGHIRNMLLGWSVAEVLDYAGHEVHKVNIYNDRGIAICKSMAAYEASGEGATPESAGIKGDHFVGSFYVAYNRLASEQAQPFVDQGMDKREAEKQTAIYRRAHAMLLAWEAGDPELRALWQTMNNWVYEGFNQTFAAIGVDFEKDYLESETYLSGKNIVLEGVQRGIFQQHEDGSVRSDLSAEGLDEKLLLRSDGSSMYITQDLGTAEQRYTDFRMDRSYYVVGSEQDYHFKVLKALLQKMERPYADGITHLSYGMVDLPTGKMKSREGTTVDADDLVADMIQTARSKTEELGKIEGLEEAEKAKLFRTLGLGALKYFILKVDPKKRILFNPAESIELVGNTGPFVQYTYARIQSILRKAASVEDPQAEGIASGFDVAYSVPQDGAVAQMDPAEIQQLAVLARFPAVVQEAASNHSPAEMANYAYEVAKTFNQFYDRVSVLNAETVEARKRRLAISALTASVVQKALGLLGIEVPERM
jgi:arginyl-tRNA synthetase